MTSASVGLVEMGQNAQYNGLSEALPANFEGRRCHGRKLGNDLKDTIKLALRQWCCHVYGYPCHDSRAN